MKLKLPFVIGVIAILSFPGCLEFKTVVTVNPDGSGTVDETLLMSSAMVEMITQFAGSFTEDTTGNVEEFSLFDEEELKSRAAEFGPSVKYTGGEKLKIDGREGYKAAYSFTSINDLTINQNPGSKVSLDNAMPPADDKDNLILFKFQKGTPSVLTIDFPEAKHDDEDDEEENVDSTSAPEGMDSTSFEQFTSLLEDLRMSVQLNVKGNITETNATYVEGSTLTFLDVNFGELLKNKEKLEELKNVTPSNPQEILELLKGITGIKIETSDPVTIKFQ